MREHDIMANHRGVILPHTLKEALERYSDTVSPSKRGCRWEQLRINLFLRELGCRDRLIASIRTQDLADYRDKRLKAISGASVRRELSLLRSIFEAARLEWGWITVNPITGIRKPPNPPHRDRIISDSERDAILAALKHSDAPPMLVKQRVALIFLLALETGMRAGEITGLEWGRVNLEKRFLTLPMTKNGDARQVPLSANAVDILRRMNGTGNVFGVSPANVDAVFRKARSKAGLSGFTFHDSRASAITRLSKKVDILTLARMIGHRDLKSLMIYFRESATDIAARLD